MLVGIGVLLIGTAAAVVVILFFVGAIITNLRAGFYPFDSFGLAVVFLLVAVAALVLGLERQGVGGVGAACGVAGAGCTQGDDVNG